MFLFCNVKREIIRLSHSVENSQPSLHPKLKIENISVHFLGGVQGTGPGLWRL